MRSDGIAGAGEFGDWLHARPTEASSINTKAPLRFDHAMGWVSFFCVPEGNRADAAAVGISHCGIAAIARQFRADSSFPIGCSERVAELGFVEKAEGGRGSKGMVSKGKT